MSISDLRTIYIADGVGVFLMLLLRYVARTKLLRDRTEDKLYSILVVGVLLGCLFDAFCFAIDGRLFPGSRFLNYAANTYIYSFNILLPLGLAFYIDLESYSDPARLWRCYKVQIVVAAIMVLLNVVNFFVPIIYDISATNVYTRRPFSYSFYAVILFLFITTIVQTLRYEKQSGTRSFVNIFVFLVPVSVGVGLQFLEYGLSMAWLSSACGLVGLYMMQQNEMAFVDPLVGTYNRQYLIRILSSWTGRKKRFVGAMLDIDHFKRINDVYGHSEGDNALRTVADILKESRKDGEWIFRFAGDEFVVLKLAETEAALQDYLREVSRRLTEFNSERRLYQLSVSIGTSVYIAGSLDLFMREMDDHLYAMKEAHHGEDARAPGRPLPRG